jgi:hypothetical protein
MVMLVIVLIAIHVIKVSSPDFKIFRSLEKWHPGGG